MEEFNAKVQRIYNKLKNKPYKPRSEKAIRKSILIREAKIRRELLLLIGNTTKKKRKSLKKS